MMSPGSFEKLAIDIAVEGVSEGGSPVCGRSTACVQLSPHPSHRQCLLHADQKGGICRADARRAFCRTARCGRYPYGGTPKSGFRPVSVLRAFCTGALVPIPVRGDSSRRWSWRYRPVVAWALATLCAEQGPNGGRCLPYRAVWVCCCALPERIHRDTLFSCSPFSKPRPSPSG
jgi:hypothetical protein